MTPADLRALAADHQHIRHHPHEVAAALLMAADEIERLRAVAQHETDAAEAYEAQVESLRDCQTCRQYSGHGACLSVLQCVDGAAYQRVGAVRLWEAK